MNRRTGQHDLPIVHFVYRAWQTWRSCLDELYSNTIYILTDVNGYVARNGINIDDVHIQSLLPLPGNRDFSTVIGWMTTGLCQNILMNSGSHLLTVLMSRVSVITTEVKLCMSNLFIWGVN